MAHADIAVAFCDDRTFERQLGDAVMGGVFGIIYFVVVVAIIASAFLLFHRRAVRNSRRIGAPGTRRTAAFRGGMLRPGKINAGRGTTKLEFFDWGVRLRCGLMMPVWEARYEELTEARLVTAPSRHGVRLRAGDGEGEILFWTRRGPEVLDHLQEHAVLVDRAADQVPDPPPIRSWAPTR